MKMVLGSPQELVTAVGQRAGPTDWLSVEQSQIDAFAATTGPGLATSLMIGASAAKPARSCGARPRQGWRGATTLSGHL